MITPSPTAKIDPVLARGTLAEVVPETATRKGYLTFAVPNSSYELHLTPTTPVAHLVPGSRLIGTIRAKSRRIDIVQSGGRYIEPVMGQPRRIQGTIIKIEEGGGSGGAIVVNAGVPIHITPTDARQSASQFQPGQFVACDLLDGTTITAS